MKKIFAVSLIVCCLSCFGQVDDSRKRTNYFCIGAGINHTSFPLRDQDGKAQFAMGYEGCLSEGIKTRRMYIFLGLGYSYNPAKRYSENDVNGLNPTKNRVSLHHHFIRVTADLNWFSAEIKGLFIGPGFEYGNLFQYDKDLKHESYMVSYNHRYHFRTPQNTFWMGLNIGKTIALRENTDLNIVLSSKLSSALYGGRSSIYVDEESTILWVNTLKVTIAFTRKK